MASFFDDRAEVGSEEDEEIDEETGEVINGARKSKAARNDLDDSSDEEEDDDEEEAQKVREGFIVDEDEDDEEEQERRRERRKRRREERDAADEMLDDEDLDLIGARPSGEERQEEQSKFKRLKRGHREERSTSEPRGVANIFDDEDDGAEGFGARRGAGFDDMDDFIEQDEFPDEEQGGMDDDLGIRAPKRSGFADLERLKESGLDEIGLEDMRGAFGDGDEFGWALEAEAQQNEGDIDPDKPLELKDVFEPSQLIEKMLTDEDNLIRATDVPERFQIARKPYKDFQALSPDEQEERLKEEAEWISNFVFPRKRLDPKLRDAFQAAVKTVLSFMNVDDFEPAFIFQNRKDYLIHSEQVPASPDPTRPDAPDYTIKAEKLLNQDDLWNLFEMDLKFRAFVERREAIQRSLEVLKGVDAEFHDRVFDDLLPSAAQMDDLQDLQDYLNFQYSAQLREMTISDAEMNGTQKRARGNRSIWDRVRAAAPYHFVRAFGITADMLAQNAEKSGRGQYIDDEPKLPVELADSLTDAEFKNSEEVLRAAKAMFIEEIVMSPRMRRLMRKIYFENMCFDVHRTPKGLKAIDEEHPYYEFKYLRNLEAKDFLLDRPELFLKMLKAESEGLVEVRVRLQGEKRLREDLYRAIESDNFSQAADEWNRLRKEALGTALERLHKIISRGLKDTLKGECENSVAGRCRKAYTDRLDQAPYRPMGMILGTIPRVLALSNGAGNRGDAVCWAYMEENGKVNENGKFNDLRLGNPDKFLPDGKDVAAFVELIERRKPDVVAVSGWSVETRRLYKDLQDLVEAKNLKGNTFEDDETGEERQDTLDVMICNDETARLYHTSKRAEQDHPTMPALARYCVGLCRYMQDPMKEYASLGRDITSISFDPNQHLVPEDKLIKSLDSSMIDMVNLTGVDVNEAAADPSVANLLQFVAGLGPRKAAQLVKAVHINGGEVLNRNEFIGVTEDGRQIVTAMGAKVFTNCASFLYIRFIDVDQNPEADYLDNTRIHPEDYDLARKIAADALEMDEEDIQAEVNENGTSAVVKKLVKEEQSDKVNDLVLEQYAVQLERQMMQRKRSTLETIRAELQAPYEELRHNFVFISSEQMFTMLTGETSESLQEGMIVPVSVKRTFPDHIDVKLDCGVDGGIGSTEYPEEMVAANLEPRNVWTTHQVIQAKITYLKKKELTAQLTLREAELKKPFRRQFDHGADEWDDELEAADKRAAKKALAENAENARAQRVIKHPFYRPFNSTQAISFLTPMNRGDCVIRPSSKGPDHLAVTWKVAEGVYQHIDVLELDKENEFSVGRVLKVGGKWTYSDLDELIVLHVKGMHKKIEEMMGDERYQAGTRQQTEQWLQTYTAANPKRSMYAFCLNPKYPGYFDLCYKAGANAECGVWPVKVIPNAFELREGSRWHSYPDTRALKNGFKLLFQQQGMKAGQQNGGIPRR